jgi:alpha-tubulin suppressor-like RCC1 family protein
MIGGLAIMAACGKVQTTGDAGSTNDAVSGGVCTDTQSDPSNCGSCGHACSAGFSCATGHCGNDVAEVVGGSAHSCVVLYGGGVYCWGENEVGQLGDGGITGPEVCRSGDDPCRPKPAPVSGLGDVIHVSAAFDHSCAVERDGSVWCWGVNGTLELGHDASTDLSCMSVPTMTTVPCNPVPTRVALPDGAKALTVAVGRGYSCVLSRTNEVYCWGDNTRGQLGVALTTMMTSTPQKVGPFIAPVTQIATDHNNTQHACALVNRQVWCWGSNYLGGNGHDPTGEPLCIGVACNFAPQLITTVQGGTFDGIVSIGVGREFGCARRTDATIWCWGSDGGWGSRGQGTTDDSTQPFPVQVNLPAASNVTAMYVGGGNVVSVVDGAGAIWAWGRNNYGLVGNGAVTGAEPTPKLTGFAGASQISMGEGSSLALKPDGTVWVWGDNSEAELGHTPGTAGDQPTAAGTGNIQCNPQPTQLHGLP